MIIAFAGRMGTGKTSYSRAVAKIFEEMTGERIPVHSFAEVIKKGAAASCGFDEELAWSQLGKRTLIRDTSTGKISTVREAITSWAAKMRKANPGIFLEIMRRYIQNAPVGMPFIIDDVRLPQEVQFLASFGSEIYVFKCVPGPDWKAGIGANDITEVALDNFKGYSSRVMEIPCLNLPKILPDGSFQSLESVAKNLCEICGIENKSDMRP